MKKRHSKFSGKRKSTHSKATIFTPPPIVSQATDEERTSFIRHTYIHLAGAIALFTLLSALMFISGAAQQIVNIFSDLSSFLRFTGLAVIIVSAVTSFLLSKKLVVSEKVKTQYFGFILHVLTEALLFSPLLYTIQSRIGNEIIAEAVIVTTGLFLGITAVAFLTRQDFSFLLSILVIVSFLTLGFLVAGYTFNFWNRSLFVFILTALAGGWMLFNTSNILHRYRSDQYIAASITLFASVITLFLAVLRNYSQNQKRY